MIEYLPAPHKEPRKAHVFRTHELVLGLQKVRGGYECVHLATGGLISPLHAIAVFRDPVLLREAKQDIITALETFPDLIPDIQDAASKHPTLNPEYNP